MSLEFREIRKLYKDGLRDVCVTNGWYTTGSTEEYIKLMAKCKKDNITTNTLVNIAADIIEHSPKLQDGDYKENMSYVLYLLNIECVTIFKVK